MIPDEPKILVVDDMPANLVAMRRLLGRSGAQVYEARSGNEALALCLDHEFALILLDVHMPEMDGFEVARLLSEADGLSDTPIIFVTAAYGDDLSQLKGYRSGAVDYIAKPINDVILQSKVRVFLDLYTARAKLQHALSELAERNEQLHLEVEERKVIEAMARHQASHDPLTGLPNRILFRDRLHGAIQRAKRHQSRFALANIDLDGFKLVNDQHGHATGDALLQEVAGRLLAHVRSNDTVARLGGDEFVLVFEEIDDLQSVMQLCGKLCAALAEPFLLQIDGRTIEVRISASIGVAPYRPDLAAGSGDRLMLAADKAMYQAKRAGKNQCALAE